MKKLLLTATLAALITTGVAYSQASRDSIFIVGSSTVYPFTTVVAEQFGKTSGFKAPKVESTGTGGGIKLFCAGVGVAHPDISNASRAIKSSELETCKKNGVTEVVEVLIGFDGLALANSKKAPHYNMSFKDVYLALAKNVPDSSGKLTPNPYKKWKEINPDLPDIEIKVFGPPPTSGTRDSFLELMMVPGCEKLPVMKDLQKNDPKAFKEACETLREDGHFVEAGEHDNLIVQKLVADPNTLGVFGFSFLDQNKGELQGVHIEGVEPTFESIAAKKYPGSRPMYMYVKKQHIGVIPGIKEFLAEYLSDKAAGKDGYLADKGMVPLPQDVLQKVRADVEAMKTL